MLLLTLGVLLFTLLHLSVAMWPTRRALLIERLGEQRYKGVFSLGVVIAFGCMLAGWRDSLATPFYTPPGWGAAAAMVMLPLAIWLLCCSVGPNHLRRWLRHPQLLAVLLWSLGHVLVNTESRALLLFGALTLWSAIEIILIIYRDGWRTPVMTPDWRFDLASFSAALLVLAGLWWDGHASLTGLPLPRI